MEESFDHIDEQLKDVITKLNELSQLCASTEEINETSGGQTPNDTTICQNDSSALQSKGIVMFSSSPSQPLLPSPLSNKETDELTSLSFESQLNVAEVISPPL